MEESTERTGNAETAETHMQIRVPKRVIHCSDGVIEEYSDDERAEDERSPVDPRTLDWIPWIVHHAVAGGNKAVEYCDYVGETLADFLGITTPKYQLELSEYERMEAAKRKLQEESAGWVNNNADNDVSLVVLQPTVTPQSDKPNVI